MYSTKALILARGFRALIAEITERHSAIFGEDSDDLIWCSAVVVDFRFDGGNYREPFGNTRRAVVIWWAITGKGNSHFALCVRATTEMLFAECKQQLRDEKFTK